MDTTDLSPPLPPEDETLDEALITTYPPALLKHRIATSPRLAQHRRITLLSDHFLAKVYDADSAEDTVQAMTAALRLGIRVPRVIRTLRSDDVVYLIMDRIPGPTLEEAWPSLSWLTTLRMALQLRRWIATLRAVVSPAAGGLQTGQCRSFWLDDHYKLPPRAGRDEVEAYLTFWDEFVSIRKELRKSPAQHLALAQPTRYTPLHVDGLVLTHHDLAPRNIVLDPSGQVWLIDWDLAGFYPPYFEYAAMNNFTVPSSWGWFSRVRWKLFAWAAAGFFSRQKELLTGIRHKILMYSAGRRRSVEVGATKRWEVNRSEADSCTSIASSS